MTAVAEDLLLAESGLLGRRGHGRPAGDRGHQRERVAVFCGGGVLAQVADILVVQVDVDETAYLALVGEDLLAQIGELRGECAQHFAYGAAGNGDGILFPGELSQGRGD